jgi:hypothetical protein
MDGGDDEPGVKRLGGSASEPEEWFWFGFGEWRNKENLRLRREGAVIGNEIVMIKKERVGESWVSHHTELPFAVTQTRERADEWELLVTQFASCLDYHSVVVVVGSKVSILQYIFIKKMLNKIKIYWNLCN